MAKGEVLGIHILSPSEIEKANALLDRGDDKDQFVTVPLPLTDLDKKERWQHFLDACHDLKLRPLIRLMTKFENGNWTVPTRGDTMAFASFLTSLEWHRPELTIILFNEPNQPKEWGGTVDPISFINISEFSAHWFHTEPKRYTVLPAGLDLAADDGKGTQEAFAFWREALTHIPTFFDELDGWTSHSYPNPGFASSPGRSDQRSLRGYTHELGLISRYTKKELPVYITETGWDQRMLTSYRLKSYFETAYTDIWSKDRRIVAVTPFLLQGAPGTFAPFSFLDSNGKPTPAYEIYKSLLEKK